MAIKLKTYTGAEVTAKDDAVLFDNIINGSGIIYGCDVTHVNSNRINVGTGKLLIKGRQIDITEEVILANLASSGSQSGRLLIHIDLSNTSEPVKFVTQVASTLPELEQNEDCNIENGIYEYEMATYTVTATAISNLTQTAALLGNNLAGLKNEIENINLNTVKIKSFIVNLTVSGNGGMQYSDLETNLTGTLVAVVPVITGRGDFANGVCSVAAQASTIAKTRIVVNATIAQSITVTVYYYYV